MTFSTDHRADLITEALRWSPLFADASKQKKDKHFKASKYRWSETRVDVMLIVRRHCLSQVDTTGRKLCDYDYKDIQYFCKVSDHPAAVALAYGSFERLHMFLVEQRDELLREVQTNSQNNIGYFVSIRKEPITLQTFVDQRFGKYGDDDCITSLTEFTVQKHSIRHTEPVQRTLALTESCIVERDPATYAIVTVQPLASVFALIRYPENPQNFAIEYNTGQIRRYTSTDRDSLLCSLLDGVRAAGNNDVCVKMRRTNIGFRLGPLVSPVEEEVESIFLKLLGTTLPGPAFMSAVEQFNANIGYSGLNHAVSQEGLFAENKEKLINQALMSLLSKEGNQVSVSPQDLESQFQALRRLVASKAGYVAFTELPNFRDSVGKKVMKALKRKEDGITHGCVDFLCALMQPMHDNFDLRQEQLNKSSLLSSKTFFENLMDVLATHIKLGTGALVISSLLDFITFAICPPYRLVS
jgi:DnaJ family protein C protein 13